MTASTPQRNAIFLAGTLIAIVVVALVCRAFQPGAGAATSDAAGARPMSGGVPPTIATSSDIPLPSGPRISGSVPIGPVVEYWPEGGKRRETRLADGLRAHADLFNRSGRRVCEIDYADGEPRVERIFDDEGHVAELISFDREGRPASVGMFTDNHPTRTRYLLKWQDGKLAQWVDVSDPSVPRIHNSDRGPFLLPDDLP